MFEIKKLVGLLSILLLTLLIGLVHSTADRSDRNETIKRSLQADNSLLSLGSATVMVPEEDQHLSYNLIETTTATNITSKQKTRPRPSKRTNTNFLSIANRCLDRHLTWRLISPFLIFTAIVGLLNGPLYALKLLIFTVQFNIVFPTFVCSVKVRRSFYL